MLCLQVLGMLPKGPLARSSFSRVGAGPVQHASTRNRLMRKLGMGSSKPGPARSANVVRRVNVRPYPIFTQHPLCCDVQEAQQCGQVCGMYAVWLSVGQESSEEEQGYLL